MHEMSVALNIIELIKDEAEKNNASAIKEFEIEVGAISGVEIDALKFALEVAVKDTLLENALQIIRKIDAAAVCSECKKEFSLETFYSPCPSCSALNIEIIKGKELKLKSITID